MRDYIINCAKRDFSTWWKYGHPDNGELTNSLLLYAIAFLAWLGVGIISTNINGIF